MIALVTDSNAQLTEDLRDRYQVAVVPLTVVVDGEAHLEGIGISAGDFFDALERGASVSTSTPSPGQFECAYRDAAAAGATGVVSVHIGSNTSGTVAAARLAASESPIPVEVVDTGSASFVISCCVWAAGEALAHGSGMAAAAATAREVADRVGNVFVLGSRDRARAGGRLGGGATGALPVLALEGGQMAQVTAVASDDAAIEAMVSYVADHSTEGAALRVGVGDARQAALGDELAGRLRALPRVRQLVRYEVGPSVAAHTGVGTFGAVFYDTAASIGASSRPR